MGRGWVDYRSDGAAAGAVQWEDEVDDAFLATFIAVGDDGFSDSSPWTERKHGWWLDFTP